MKHIVTAFFTISLMAISACSREEVALTPTTLNNIEDQILSFDLMDDALDEVEYTSEIFWGSLKSGFTDCRTVTVEPMDRLTWPKTITIDFGTEGCLVRDTLVKKGTIIISMSGPHFGTTWTQVITFDNYFVNGNKLEGTTTTTFSRENGPPTWTSVIEGAQVTTAQGVIRTREAIHIRVQTRGLDTLRDWSDDAFQLSGQANGSRRDGKIFSWVIKEPLVISNNCRWIRKGIKVISLEGQSDITVDYGDNTCDKIALLTQNGVSKQITLRGRRR